MDSKKLEEMHFLEQNLQSIYLKKQSFSMELSEIENSLSEAEKTKEDIYKLIGQLMIKVKKEKIIEELNDKKKFIESRLNLIQNQEKSLEEQVKKLREELMNSQKEEN